MKFGRNFPTQAVSKSMEVMPFAAQHMPEEKTGCEKGKKRELEVKILSHSEAKSLMEEARIKYKRAFEILKDK